MGQGIAWLGCMKYVFRIDGEVGLKSSELTAVEKPSCFEAKSQVLRGLYIIKLRPVGFKSQQQPHDDETEQEVKNKTILAYLLVKK